MKEAFEPDEIFEKGEEDGEMLALRIEEEQKDPSLIIFYVIFGEEHLHPDTEEPMVNYWVEIEACAYREAFLKLVESLYGMRWKSLLWKHEFDEIKGNITGGCYERNPTKVSNPLEHYMFPNIEDL